MSKKVMIEHVGAVGSAKKPERRTRRIERVVEGLGAQAKPRARMAERAE